VAVAVTTSNQLIRFNAARPDRLLSRKPLAGLQPGEHVLGLDYRAKGDMLYAAGQQQPACTRWTSTAARPRPVGAPFAGVLAGQRISASTSTPPSTASAWCRTAARTCACTPTPAPWSMPVPTSPGLQTDGPTAYAPTDRHAGQPARVVAAAYSYNKADPKLTTNFAIDAGHGVPGDAGQPRRRAAGGVPQRRPAVHRGRAGRRALQRCQPRHPRASPTRPLRRLSAAGSRSSRWVQVDLQTGAARQLGTIAGGEAVRAIALESW
jgi:hypothetical protein